MTAAMAADKHNMATTMAADKHSMTAAMAADGCGMAAAMATDKHNTTAMAAHECGMATIMAADECGMAAAMAAAMAADECGATAAVATDEHNMAATMVMRLLNEVNAAVTALEASIENGMLEGRVKQPAMDAVTDEYGEQLNNWKSQTRFDGKQAIMEIMDAMSGVKKDTQQPMVDAVAKCGMVRQRVPVTMSQKVAVTAMTAMTVVEMASRALLPQALATSMRVTLSGFGGQQRNLLHGTWGW